MSDDIHSDEIKHLFEQIKLSNNGYLVLDYMRYGEAAVARKAALDGHVQITNGTVHLPASKPEFFKTPYPAKSIALRHDGPDYEAAILGRQEAAGVHD